MNQQRAAQLRSLIDLKFNGRQIDFSKKTKISTAQVGQWLGGHRVMNEKSARKIEQLCGLTSGWLDGSTDTKDDSSVHQSGGWPFIEISESEWINLPDRTKGLIEGYVKKMIEQSQKFAANSSDSQKESPREKVA